jgi:hypothetical protein
VTYETLQAVVRKAEWVETNRTRGYVIVTSFGGVYAVPTLTWLAHITAAPGWLRAVVRVEKGEPARFLPVPRQENVTCSSDLVH